MRWVQDINDIFRVGPTSSIDYDLFQALEQRRGKLVRVVITEHFGYEGKLHAISRNPPGIFLTDADAIILRSTIADPIPQVASRVKHSELFIHLDSIFRMEFIGEA